MSSLGRILDPIIVFCSSSLRRIIQILNTFQAKLRFGDVGKKVRIYFPCHFYYYRNVFIGNNVRISNNCTFLCSVAAITIKDNVMIGAHVLLVAGNHNVTTRGEYLIESKAKLPKHDKGIIICEDALISFNSIILDGVTIGRGAVVGSGTVIRKSIPPYSIVVGNPAKVVGFRFSPNEIVEHEKNLYEEGDRLNLEELEVNYKQHYVNKLSDIVSFLKL